MNSNEFENNNLEDAVSDGTAEETKEKEPVVAETEEETETAEENNAEKNSPYFDSPNERIGAEYEMSYSSKEGKTFFNYVDAPKNPKKEERKTGASFGVGAVAIICCVCIVISSLCGGIFGYVAANFAGAGNSYPEMSGNGGQSPAFTWTNGADPYVNEAIANAVAKTIDSVVVIETYVTGQNVGVDSNAGAGSGVIWSSDGYILTCNHVVEGYENIMVILNDKENTSYPAKIIGTDPQTDLAIIKIEASGLPAVTAGVYSPVIGQSVIAIGNSLGELANTVSDGIISGLEREVVVEDRSMVLMQTNAAVSPGNSGGGLFDINGKLIGIVNAKSVSSDAEGLGFAVPMTTAYNIATEIIDHGYVTGRPQIGIKVVTVTLSNWATIYQNYPELQDYVGYKKGWGGYTLNEGIYIIDTEAVKGYAEGSEQLKFGDMLYSIDGTVISEFADVSTVLLGFSAGDTIELTIMRNSKPYSVELILGQAGAK